MTLAGLQVNGGTLTIANIVRDYFLSSGVEIRLASDGGGLFANLELDDFTEVDFEGYERQVPATWEEAFIEDNIGNVRSDYVEFNNDSQAVQFALHWLLVDPSGAGKLLLFGLLDNAGPKSIPNGTSLSVRVNWRHSQLV